MSTVRGPQRRVTDHFHPEYWEEAQQIRYEDKIAQEIHALRRDVKSLSDRILMMLGALGLLAFLLPLVAPFVRSLFGLS